MLQKLRLIHLVFIVSIPLCAWVAQSSCPSNSSDWTLWHWVITGLAVYSAFVGFFYRRKLMRSSEAALRGDASNSKALKQWQAAQIVSMAAAEAIAFYGVVFQMVLAVHFHRRHPFTRLVYFCCCSGGPDIDSSLVSLKR